jgi:hypothetical protein
MKCSILYIGDGIWLNVCECDSWGMALNFVLKKSFDSMEDRKGIRDNKGEVNGTNTFLTHEEKSRLILNGCYIGIHMIFKF